MKPIIYVLSSDLKKVGRGVLFLAALALAGVTFVSVVIFLDWFLFGGDDPTLTRYWAAIIYGGSFIFFAITLSTIAWAISVFERSEKHDRP